MITNSIYPPTRPLVPAKYSDKSCRRADGEGET